jgi:putative flippase GtrA
MTTTLVASSRRARIGRIGKFGVVGILGLGVNLVVQAVLTEILGLNYLAAAVAATQVSSTVNFLLADAWVFESGTEEGRIRRYVSFLVMNNAALALRAPMMWGLTHYLGLHYTLSNLASLVVMTLVRFGVADNVIWRTREEDSLPEALVIAGESALLGLSPSELVAEEHADAEPREETPVYRSTHHAGDMLAAVMEPLAYVGVRSDEPPEPGEAEQSYEAPTRRREWRQYLVVSTIVVCGAIIRLLNLTAVGYNSDEAVYAGQAAAIAGDSDLSKFFPIFRAHPMLFQASLSLLYQFGTSDLVGRLAAVAFGLATIVAVFAATRLMYGRRSAYIAAMIVALMPYHVIVSRQVLLDGPMTFFATLSLYLLAKFAVTRQLGWLLGASGAIGLTVLSKETYIVLLGSAFMFFALSPEFRLRMKEMVLALVVFGLVVLPFPLTIIAAGKSETGKSYLSWQLFRRPNHDLGFYPATVPWYIGPLVLLAAIAGIAVTWGRQRTWRERLLISWFLIPVAFFEVWPVKGFHYLLGAAIPIAILAAGMLGRFVEGNFTRQGRPTTRPQAVGLALIAATALSLAVPSWIAVQPVTASSLLAGTGGVPGGREMGEWVRKNVPEGAEFMTVGPSMANLVRFYGHRLAFGLSVSPNPLNRNPSYEPIINPDQAIRNSNLQYLVWDSYSTSRSHFFGDKIVAYAERYHGRVIYTYKSAGKETIVIFEVRP